MYEKISTDLKLLLATDLKNKKIYDIIYIENIERIDFYVVKKWSKSNLV